MSKKLFTDQLGREVEINFPPQRIVSVVPSQTELLYDLELEQEAIGITKFCIHPKEWFRNKTRIGGTKALDIEKIKALNPDLVIANKEENELAQIEELSKHFPVWISDIKTLQDALVMIEQVGEITHRKKKAQDIVQQIKDSFNRFNSVKKRVHKRCAYFIWWNPVMSLNKDTFINDMLKRCGWQNVFSEREDSRYPEITDEQLIEANPEIILLSSEPFPFAEKHIAYFQKLLPKAQVLFVDGEMFSWYGSRLVQSVAYLEKLIEEMEAAQ